MGGRSGHLRRAKKVEEGGTPDEVGARGEDIDAILMAMKRHTEDIDQETDLDIDTKMSREECT